MESPLAAVAREESPVKSVSADAATVPNAASWGPTHGRCSAARQIGSEVRLCALATSLARGCSAVAASAGSVPDAVAVAMASCTVFRCA